MDQAKASTSNIATSTFDLQALLSNFRPLRYLC
jgi:hypothetical protein